MNTVIRLVVTGGLLSSLLLVVGCGGRAESVSQEGLAVGDRLEVTLQANRRVTAVGDTMHLTITAKNPGWTPVRIESATLAPTVAILWRYDSLKGWVRHKKFPPVAPRQHRQWILGRNETRTFTMNLPVEADWPVLETLKLTAELNGRPDLRPHVFVHVEPTP